MPFSQSLLCPASILINFYLFKNEFFALAELCPPPPRSQTSVSNILLIREGEIKLKCLCEHLPKWKLLKFLEWEL